MFGDSAARPRATPISSATCASRWFQISSSAAGTVIGAPYRCTMSEVDPLALRAGRSRSLAGARSRVVAQAGEELPRGARLEDRAVVEVDLGREQQARVE